MSDRLAGFRAKKRFVTELRYPVEPRFLDSRGHIISAIFPQIKKDFPFWISQPGNILFGDNESSSKLADQFFVSVDKTSIIIEDSKTIERYQSDVEEYFGFVWDIFGEKGWIKEINRIGIRFIQILNTPSFKNVEDLKKGIIEKFHVVPKGLNLNFVDSFVTMVHEYGNFQLGPTWENDEWVRKSFVRLKNNVPPFGFALDVDSFATNIPITSKEDLIKAFHAVLKITLSVEEAVFSILETINDK